MLLGKDAADQADDGPFVWEDTDHVCAALDLLVEPLLRVIAPDLAPMFLGKREVRRGGAFKPSTRSSAEPD
jgi:hypothetical protein